MIVAVTGRSEGDAPVLPRRAGAGIHPRVQARVLLRHGLPVLEPIDGDGSHDGDGSSPH